MPIMFNSVLAEAGVAAESVLLLRHQDAHAKLGRTAYRLWRDDRSAFEQYQSGQRSDFRKRFARPYWASFVGAPEGQTLFVGLYRVLGCKPDASDAKGDVYDLERAEPLQDCAGLLYIDWGAGLRAWIQRADKQNKPIIELRRDLKEPDFPGYAAFLSQLSAIESLPPAWATALSASRGVYLLTCPRTNEQYVGAAVSTGGFLARWLDYARTGHGGNIALKSRDPSDYRVSILEVAGSAASIDDVLAMEARWKEKLQSREMGLNRN